MVAMYPDARILQMASGNISVFITEDVSWETFPDRADEFIAWAGGHVLKRIDAPVERLWIIRIEWRRFWLGFEDYFLGMSLDSMSSLANPVARRLHQRMVAATR